MDQCHVSARGCDSISAYSSQKSPSMERGRGQLPRPRHHRAEASWPIDQVRFSGAVRHTTRLGGDGRITNEQQVDEIGGCTGLTIPVVAWSTPWTILGGRVQLLAAWPAVEVGVQRNPGLDLPGTYFNGMYNPAVFGQLAWDLGYGWGFSYLLGAYFDYHSPVAWSDTSLNQRFALSYTGNDWAATAN